VGDQAGAAQYFRLLKAGDHAGHAGNVSDAARGLAGDQELGAIVELQREPAIIDRVRGRDSLFTSDRDDHCGGGCCK